MSTDKLWTVISGIEYQLNILKDKLKNLDEETKQSVDEAYQRGLQDGKKAIHKGCEGCRYSGTPQGDSPCFSCSNYYSNNWQKQDDEIKVGDEVIYNNTIKCLVVRPETDERYAVLIDGNGHHHSADHRECKKTGKHFDIDKILEEMRT